MNAKTLEELNALILETPSMLYEERLFWFFKLKEMTDDQIQRLYDILKKEKEQFRKLEEKYQRDMKILNEKHTLEWEELEKWCKEELTS